MNSTQRTITIFITLLAQSITAMNVDLNTLIAKQQKLNTKLGIAAQNGSIKKVQKCIDNGADLLIPACKYGALPLMKAAYAGHLPVVKLLVEHAADINLPDEALGMTPFHAAISQGQFSVVQYLAYNNANLLLHDSYQRSPSLIARSRAHDDIAQFLEQLPNKRTYRNLIDAVKEEDVDQVINLLKEKRVNVNERDICGNTPLWWAAKTGHLRIAQLLLRNNADTTITNEKGETSLAVAVESGNEALADLILQ